MDIRLKCILYKVCHVTSVALCLLTMYLMYTSF